MKFTLSHEMFVYYFRCFAFLVKDISSDGVNVLLWV